jgi:endoglucanase Acf2
MRQRTLIIGLAGGVIILALGTALLLRHQFGQPTDQVASGQSLVDQTALATLPTKNASSADTSHLDPAILPPTNTWLSGMVLQKTPLAVYPMPLSFLAKETGFEVGLPTVTTSATTITGEHIPGVIASIADAAAFSLTRYDKVSASLTYRNSQHATLGTLTLSEGSPYVFFHATTNGTLTFQDLPTHTVSPHYLRYTKAGHDYVVVTDENTTITGTGPTATIHTTKDSLVTLYALPDAKSDSLRAYAGNEVTRVDTSHSSNSSSITTQLDYHTANGKPTAYAAMNYQTVTNAGPVLTTYDNIYGSMEARAGQTLTTTVPTVSSSNQLDLSHVTAAHKQKLIASLRDDIAHTTITAKDSYYAGKQLARAANLLDVASQLGQQDSVRQLTDILRSALLARLGGSYFYYDTTLKGVAAQTKAFGSEDFNDHHFHYGYIIYAASILGRYDHQFVTDNQKQINLLVADIASYNPSSSFPVERPYDAYAGHSWAAGLAPFADGNNQESSSEAINAWNAVTLWGNLIHNSTLTATGEWMLSNESSAARHAWRTSPTHIPDQTQYASPLTSLNFSGKRTYSTFFSDEANAKVGIQLIPMNPVMTSFAADGDTGRPLIAAAITNNNFNVALGDYILMYLSLFDPSRAESLLAKQQTTFIDDGNSQTYLHAFVYAQSDK